MSLLWFKNLFKPLGPAFRTVLPGGVDALAFIINGHGWGVAGANPGSESSYGRPLLKHWAGHAGVVSFGADSVDSQHLTSHADWHPGGVAIGFELEVSLLAKRLVISRISTYLNGLMWAFLWAIG